MLVRKSPLGLFSEINSSSLSIWFFSILLFSFSCNSEQKGSQDGDKNTPLTETKVDTSQQVDAPVPIPEPDTIIPVKISEFEQVFMDSGLVDIETLDSTFVLDIKYSTEDNFLKYDVYEDYDKCYLRKAAADKLLKAQKKLNELSPGSRLLLFDCCRPRRVQYTMWEILKIPNKVNYLANPDKGSVHNYGCAVDLSIVDSMGTEMDMGTAFDFFGPLAQPKLEKQMLAKGKLTEEHVQNRKLLKDVMISSGFYPIRTEWWHFNAFPSKTVKSRYNMIY